VTLLAVDHLSKSFGPVLASNDISLHLAAGEVLGVIGPEGAGKTTLLDLIGGQLRPDRGRVRLGDDDITRAGPRAISRLGVGRTFQQTAIFSSMTVRENVQIATLSARDETYRVGRAARHRHISRANLLLHRLGLLDQADRNATALDPSDRRRLDLALALAHRPRLLLLDEPFAGMTPNARAAVSDFLRELASVEGVAILLASDDPSAVDFLANRRLLVERGTVSPV